MDCDPGTMNSITHTSRDPKFEVEAFWAAPPDYQGSIFFRYCFFGLLMRYKIEPNSVIKEINTQENL